MKFILYKPIYIALILCAAFLLCSSKPESMPKKVVLTTHNLYPYGSYPKGNDFSMIANDSFRGVAVDVVRCVFLKMGIELEIHVVPWGRAQYMVRAGAADGFFAASQSAHRDEYAVMSDIIAEQNWNWYLLKENPLDPNDHSFKEQAIVSGFLGSNMLKWMEEHNYNIIGKPPTTEHLLKLILTKRVDAVMANNYVMAALLKKYRAEDKVKIYLHKNKPLGIYFSKEFLDLYPGFLKRFNELVRECRL